MTLTMPRLSERSRRMMDKLVVALPEPGLSLSQDAEWCVVRNGEHWRQIRFHDYHELYSVPGLYEKVIYDVLKCDSPAKVRELLQAELEATGTDPGMLRVLDLGAGNGIVGEELAEIGVRFVVGVDIIEEAAQATHRDRPGLYQQYHIVDLTQINGHETHELVAHGFNCLTCVAALGFSDIPTRAFATAYNLIEPGGWVAFNIKEAFLRDKEPTGFARLIRTMITKRKFAVRRKERYRHRLSTGGKPLYYVAMVATKKRDITEDMLD